MRYNTGQVARLAGISARTLHHYDTIGLLVPSRRSPAGHRLYAATDLQRLQQILFYRELGFSLREIAAILDDPTANAAMHLRRQRRLLKQRIERLRAMLVAIDRALEAERMGLVLTPEERLEVFGSFDPDAFVAEVEERWGEIEACHQAAQRTASYSKEDWLQIRAEQQAIEQGFVAVLGVGLAPGSAEVGMLVERHRQHIDRWYYPCSPEMHRRLAELYVDDPRFAARFEALAPGLARYLHDAILASTRDER
jgi:DNA-binding transcriptional MerR regulator